MQLKNFACVYVVRVRVSASACVHVRLRPSASVCVHLRPSACISVSASAHRKLNVRTRLDTKKFCVQMYLLFKDFRDVLYYVHYSKLV